MVGPGTRQGALPSGHKLNEDWEHHAHLAQDDLTINLANSSHGVNLAALSWWLVHG